MLAKFLKTYCLSLPIGQSRLSKSVIESLHVITILVHLEFIISTENVLINTYHLFQSSQLHAIPSTALSCFFSFKNTALYLVSPSREIALCLPTHAKCVYWEKVCHNSTALGTLVWPC